jgi:hypothetical protein
MERDPYPEATMLVTREVVQTADGWEKLIYVPDPDSDEDESVLRQLKEKGVIASSELTDNKLSVTVFLKIHNGMIEPPA